MYSIGAFPREVIVILTHHTIVHSFCWGSLQYAEHQKCTFCTKVARECDELSIQMLYSNEGTTAWYSQ